MPYLQSATPTSIWINWETTGSGNSTVAWGQTVALGQQASGSALVGKGDSRIHQVKLNGLKPNTEYWP